MVVAAQATILDQPASPSLLDFVHQWELKLTIGDLRTLAMADSARELRFWEGFGLGGTRGLLLRRTGTGEWSALRFVIQGNVMRTDTLSLPKTTSIYHPELVWANLVATGMLTLPTNVPRKWMMLDGHTYVLEVREGQFYRASIIEDLEKPEVPADATIRRLARLLSPYFQP
jgi:hypothetical protein